MPAPFQNWATTDFFVTQIVRVLEGFKASLTTSLQQIIRLCNFEVKASSPAQ